MTESTLPQAAKPKSTNPVRVLVVDDSAFLRFSLSQHLNENPDILVVGTAIDGKDAIKQIPQLLPDVVTLDVEMPQMNGIATLRHIMRNFPRPVIMFSSLTKEGAAETIQALMLGAVDFVAKPDNRLDIRQVMDDMVTKILAAAKARIKPVQVNLRMDQPVLPTTPNIGTEKNVSIYQKTTPVLFIGSSTGGPSALNDIIPALPANFPSPVMVVQHMPVGFTRSLADRLNAVSALKVKEAEAGDRLLVGQVLVAPGGFHMVLDENERVALNQNPTVHGVRPAVDVTLTSLVQRFGKGVVAVILTGMGSDGTNGAALLHSQGGYVIAEHESTCVVWGMPRSVAEAGAANAILPRPQIPRAIERAVRDYSAL